MSTPILQHSLLNKTVTIAKGCDSLAIHKNQKAVITEISLLGAEYGHSVAVRLSFGGRTTTLYARHINRLGDSTFNLNNGNPLKKITIRS